MLLGNLRLVRRYSLVLAALGRGVDICNTRGEVRVCSCSHYSLVLPPAPQTPLHLAVERGEEVITAELTRRGAQPWAVTTRGDTALHLAIRCGRSRSRSRRRCMLTDTPHLRGGSHQCVASLLKRSPGRKEVDALNDLGEVIFLYIMSHKG